MGLAIGGEGNRRIKKVEEVEPTSIENAFQRFDSQGNREIRLAEGCQRITELCFIWHCRLLHHS